MSEKRCLGCMRLKQNTPVCEHCGYDERMTNPPSQLSPGTILNNQYIIGRVLGQGGFGITYIGWDLSLGIPVAIKEFYPSGVVTRDSTHSTSVFLVSDKVKDRFVTNRERFVREATSLARLGRSSGAANIVRIQNLIQANSTAYIIMEYVEGIDMRGYMRRKGGVLTLAEALHLLLPLMESLEIVHNHHIVHRDISPDNIMVLPDGTTKLIDFGAAHEVQQDDEGNQKSTEAILKYGFAPPEQYQRKGDLGPWTDVYALCATIYYCTTGKLPPNATDRLLGSEDFQWEAIPGISPEMIQVLQQGTAVNKAQRIQTMGQLHQALVSGTAPIASEPEIKSTAAIHSTAVQDSASVPHKEPIQKKSKKGLIAGILTIAAAAAVAFGLQAIRPAAQTAPENVPAQTTAATAALSSNWEENILMRRPDYEEYPTGSEPNAVRRSVFGSQITNDEIEVVTFLDTLADAPANSWDVSHNQDGRVMAWTESVDTQDPAARYHLYIAAEGGINGAEAAYQLFAYFYNLRAVNFNGVFHTDYAVSMAGMFHDCSSLTDVDVSGFDTANVTEMGFMFDGCSSLASLDVSGFDTANVTEMGFMFDGCSSLASLDLSGFDTANVTDMINMFYGCSSLISLDLSSFDTSNATDMWSMFEGCSSLTFLDVSSFDTANVTNMYNMFTNCSSLTSLDVSNFNTSNVSNMHAMFEGCSSLTSLDISNFDTVKVEFMSGMFRSCSNLSSLDLTNFNTFNVTNMSQMFGSCSSLSSLDVSSFDTSKVTDMCWMFYKCSSLTSLDLSSFNTWNVTNMSYMFSDCDSLSNLNVSNFDTRNVKDMSRMFVGTPVLKNVSMPKIQTSQVQRFIGVSLGGYGYIMDEDDAINGRPWKSYFKPDQYGGDSTFP